MVKQTVCENANEALSAYNEALETNNALQMKSAAAKKRIANVITPSLFHQLLI